MANLKVLFLSHTPDNGIFKVGSHHLARELSKRSVSVAHVSTPRSLAHKALGRVPRNSSTRADKPQTLLDEFGTLHVTPNFVLPLQIAQSGRALGKVIRKIGYEDADFILLDQPLMSGYISSCRPKGKVIYRPTDIYSRNPAAGRQAKILKNSDGVVATSGAVLNRLGLARSTPSLVLENGVELSRFVSEFEVERSGFIYVGAVDYRFDWESVAAIANANPDQQITIIGPLTTRPLAALPQNVSLSGSVSYEELPSYLQRARVGLIPLNSTEVNQGRSPMKYYEYLAAGLSVLATSTPALLERKSSQTYLFDSPTEAGSMSNIAIKASSPNLKGIQEAFEQDWATKAASLLSFLRSL
jgi:teichuronic acid biosynthesis glycosyltransferase TuaH